MERLFEIFALTLKNIKYPFIRGTAGNIDWDNRLIAVTGARGVGKTTMILQYIKEHFKINESILYTSLDNIYFAGNTLFSLAEEFIKNGGNCLFIDEVHKYSNWAVEIKNIYDVFSGLKLVFTGSSILQIYKGYTDLSRRAVAYEMQGLSFREFIELNNGTIFQKYSLDDILSNHVEISLDISSKIRPLVEFKKYLKFGYYPYFKENVEMYHQKLANTLNVILESDLPTINIIDYRSIPKLKKLLFLIATSVPFKANFSKMSERIGVSRHTIVHFFDYLEKAKVINSLNSLSKGYSYLSKPEKIYLNNSNIMYAISPDNADIGNIRETFFLNQVSQSHIVNISDISDFIVDEKYTFEIGGKNKQISQLKGTKQIFIAKDDIETGYLNTIPLWLFGFLY